MILVFDGPEKAGKSTIVNAIRDVLDALGYKVNVRRWGPVSPDDRVYAPALKEDVLFDGITIWDRSWASEHVYGKLLKRNRRLTNDAFLGEWLHSRVVQTTGERYMVTSDLLDLDERRDDTDLPVDPRLELAMYDQYARTYGWHILKNTYTSTSLHGNVAAITSRAIREESGYNWKPPQIVGPYGAPVLFVIQEPLSTRQIEGGWIPGTSLASVQLGRKLGSLAFKCQWTTFGALRSPMLANRSMVVFAGDAPWLSSSIYGATVVNIGDFGYTYAGGPSWIVVDGVEVFVELRDLVQSAFHLV